MFRKNFSRFRKALLPIIGVLLLVVFVGLLMPGETKANWVADGFISVIGSFGGKILELLGALLGLLIEMTIKIFRFNNFVNMKAPPAVHIGWTIVRDLSNMMFIVILIVIAFGTIMKIQAYHARSLLTKMIIMIILINFSKTITGLFVDFSQVIMLTFVDSFSDSAPIVLTVGLNLNQMVSFAKETDGKLGVVSVLVAVFLANAMLVVAIAVILAMLVILIYRILNIWILVILSPIAYVASVLPNTSRYASRWWSELGKNLSSGPILAFFLWLSLSIISTSAGAPIDLSDPSIGGITNEPISDELDDTQLPKGASAIMNTQNMFNYIITIALLLTGIMLTQELGVMGGSTAAKFPAMAKKIGMGAVTKPFSKGSQAWAWGARKIRAGGIGKKNAEGRGFMQGVDLNPASVLRTMKGGFDRKRDQEERTGRVETGRRLEQGGFTGGILGAGSSSWVDNYAQGFLYNKGIKHLFKGKQGDITAMDTERHRQEEEMKKLQEMSQQQNTTEAYTDIAGGDLDHAVGEVESIDFEIKGIKVQAEAADNVYHTPDNLDAEALEIENQVSSGMLLPGDIKSLEAQSKVLRKQSADTGDIKLSEEADAIDVRIGAGVLSDDEKGYLAESAKAKRAEANRLRESRRLAEGQEKPSDLDDQAFQIQNTISSGVWTPEQIQSIKREANDKREEAEVIRREDPTGADAVAQARVAALEKEAGEIDTLVDPAAKKLDEMEELKAKAKAKRDEAAATTDTTKQIALEKEAVDIEAEIKDVEVSPGESSRLFSIAEAKRKDSEKLRAVEPAERIAELSARREKAIAEKAKKQSELDEFNNMTDGIDASGKKVTRSERQREFARARLKEMAAEKEAARQALLDGGLSDAQKDDRNSQIKAKDIKIKVVTDDINRKAALGESTDLLRKMLAELKKDRNALQVDETTGKVSDNAKATDKEREANEPQIEFLKKEADKFNEIAGREDMDETVRKNYADEAAKKHKIIVDLEERIKEESAFRPIDFLANLERRSMVSEAARKIDTTNEDELMALMQNAVARGNVTDASAVAMSAAKAAHLNEVVMDHRAQSDWYEDVDGKLTTIKSDGARMVFKAGQSMSAGIEGLHVFMNEIFEKQLGYSHQSTLALESDLSSAAEHVEHWTFGQAVGTSPDGQFKQRSRAEQGARVATERSKRDPAALYRLGNRLSLSTEMWKDDSDHTKGRESVLNEYAVPEIMNWQRYSFLAERQNINANAAKHLLGERNKPLFDLMREKAISKGTFDGDVKAGGKGGFRKLYDDLLILAQSEDKESGTQADIRRSQQLMRSLRMLK
ncbi:MAG: hypothetical protein WCW66_03050 [Patescibacteria group bacterium]